MSFVKNKYHLWFFFWFVITALAVLLIPSDDQLKQNDQVPATYQSAQAKQIASQFHADEKGAKTVVIVYSNGKKPLTTQQNQAIDQTVRHIKQQASQHHIVRVIDAADGSDEKAQLVSKDQATRLVQLTVKSTQIQKMTRDLSRLAQTKGVSSAVTGSDILDQAFTDATATGVAKTEVIAVIFIFVVLIFVFKSPITPILSLATVGISAVIGISLVYNMVKYWGLSYSDLTEPFIIIVLFGIGTDYNILLFNEFRQGLTQGLDKWQASRSALRVGGRTIIFAGVSVLIGMGTLYFADFYLYKSAFGIAIGIAVLLLVLLTLNPWLMTTFGHAMFWPVKKFSGERESRLWQFFAKTAIARPLIAVGTLLLLVVPVAIQQHGDLNYDSAVEVSDQIPAKRGYLTIQQHFSKGIASPTTIYIKAHQSFDNSNSLQVIDRVTQNLKTIARVDQVMSVTQPTGSPLKALYVKNQLADVTTGLGDASQGLTTIQSGLNAAKSKVDQANMGESVASVNALGAGSQQVAAGAATLQKGISQITANVNQLHQQLGAGANQDAAINQLVMALPALNQAIAELNARVHTVGNTQNNGAGMQLTQIGQSASDIGAQLRAINTVLQDNQAAPRIDSQALIAQMKQSGVVLSPAQEKTIQDNMTQQLAQQQQAAQATQQMVADKLQKIGTAAQTIGDSDAALATQMQGLNATTTQLQQAIGQLTEMANTLLPASAATITQLSQGMRDLSDGTTQLATAMNTVNDNTSTLTQGAQLVANGNGQLANGMSGLANQMSTLSGGLGRATQGLSDVNGGTQAINRYVAALQKTKSAEVFYMPNASIHRPDFKAALDNYLSDNRKIALLTVNLKGDPTTVQATQTIDDIHAVVLASLAGTKLAHAQVAIGGQTSATKDLNDLASQDFFKTAIIMLSGILFALLFVTRSIWQSLAIEATLVLSYYAALNLVYWVSDLFLGQHHLTWNTPFFAFIMLISLGVDYTIFLMLKYRDELAAQGDIQGHVRTSIMKATAMIGTVVLSAAIILAGTFAALIPSGVLTLIQVALVVIVGLVLLVILIPLVLPAVIQLTSPSTLGQKRRVVNKRK